MITNRLTKTIIYIRYNTKFKDMKNSCLAYITSLLKILKPRNGEKKFIFSKSKAQRLKKRLLVEIYKVY